MKPPHAIMVVGSDLAIIKGVATDAFSPFGDVHGLRDEDIDGFNSAGSSKKIRRIHMGFSVEDESAAIALGLGRVLASARTMTYYTLARLPSA